MEEPTTPVLELSEENLRKDAVFDKIANYATQTDNCQGTPAGTDAASCTRPTSGPQVPKSTCPNNGDLRDQNGICRKPFMKPKPNRKKSNETGN